MEGQTSVPPLEALYRERDINQWHSVFTKLQQCRPDKVQRVPMILDRGHLGCITFETLSPRFDNTVGLDLGTRYLSAWVNNAVMTWGCRNVFLPVDVYDPVVKVMETRYSHVSKLLRNNFGQDCGVWPINVDLHMGPHAPRRRSSPTPDQLDTKPIAGIDIGQTSIKLVVIHRGKIVFRHRAATFPHGVRSLEALRGSLTSAIVKARAWYGDLGAFGIAWVGEVRDVMPLSQASDPSAIRAKEDEEKIRAWLDEILHGNTGSLHVYSDSEALGRALPIIWPQSKLYVVVFGTSVAGAYLNGSSEYEDGFGLIARVVVDMSEDALPHASTKVRGVLQQYVASRGILAAIESLSKFDEYAWLADSKLDKESSGRLLQMWLESDDPRQKLTGHVIVHKVSRWIAAGAMAMAAYYDVDMFGFTGTIMKGEVGRAIVRATQQTIRRKYHRSDVQISLSPFDLTYGVAIGAAYSAATDS